MRRTASWPGIVLLALAVGSFATVQAGTTVMQVRLGDSFTGVIDSPGSDTVQAGFNVIAGTSIRIAVSADEGGSLRPTLVLRDGSGMMVSPEQDISIDWLPSPNIIRFYTAAQSGAYTAEIGGSSGSGGFAASVTGQQPGGIQLATVSGSVEDSFSGAGIAGASVKIGPYALITDAEGNYAGQLPVGDYALMVEATDYLPFAGTIELVPSAPTSLLVNLSLINPVEVEASVSGTAMPGAALEASVDVNPMDGSTVESYLWTQVHGVPVTITGATTDTASVTLGSLEGYREALIEHLSEPPVTAEQLPPNVPLPPGEFPGGLQDRFQVVGINPFALEEAGVVTLEVEVTTSTGSYTEEVEVHVALPWVPQTGIRNVPIGVPVLLHGKTQGSYDWSLTPASGSSATLIGGTTQSPDFTPDVPGFYLVEVTDEAEKTTVELEIHAGTWQGVIEAQDFAGRPVPDPSCTVCHSTSDEPLAPDKFTPWIQTGHAEIFTNNLNNSTHYGPNCFPCHTVGYGTTADNGGADDASDYPDFLDAELINNPGDNWTRVIEDHPATARLANIQCENCHGPQAQLTNPSGDSDAHGWNAPDGEPRVSISSDVCATCHGEPLRHARFQQWQLSAHANYELAIEESGSGNCSRCHTGNGFLKWFEILIDDDPETNPLDSVSVDWTEDEAHPQTCATCHDPHAIGTVSGADTNATVRISGDTPPLIGGFMVEEAGKGAICMTCHNSRRGLRNDETFETPEIQGDLARAPHGSAQTDVLVGQNAFLVDVGLPGGHATIEDTCVACHMNATPPPDVLSYNSGGTNHTFFADIDICGDCHTGLDGAVVQDTVQGFLDEVGALIEQQYGILIAKLLGEGKTIDLNGAAEISSIGQVEAIEFGETRGRQAIAVTIGGESFGLMRLTDIDVKLAGVKIGELYEDADDALIKAGWNWNLFNNDGSLGVHNPDFAFQGLIAARNALEDLEITAKRIDTSLMRARQIGERWGGSAIPRRLEARRPRSPR